MTSESDMEIPKGLEYEFCAVIRDSALIYLRTARTNEGYVERIFAIADEMTESLGREILTASGN